jgi:hypothetical protein
VGVGGGEKLGVGGADLQVRGPLDDQGGDGQLGDLAGGIVREPFNQVGLDLGAKQGDEATRHAGDLVAGLESGDDRLGGCCGAGRCAPGQLFTKHLAGGATGALQGDEAPGTARWLSTATSTASSGSRTKAPPGGTKASPSSGGVLGELNIDIICANSPQTKGRVERMNSTVQDRLFKDAAAALAGGRAGSGDAKAPPRKTAESVPPRTHHRRRR